MVKISVIIPVYNVEKYLEECLDSVVNQTLEDIEIICINDGSTDKSLDILNRYAQRDSRLKVVSQDNHGLGYARNVGIEKSSGDYIYFIDSDDYISLDMLEQLYQNANHNGSDIVVSKIARFNDNEIDYSNPGFDFDNQFNNVDFNNFTFNYKDIKRYVLNTSFAPWMKLFKREFIIFNDFKFTESLAFEDILFHVKSFLKAEKISFVPSFFYHYRNNPNSIINTSSSGFDIFKIVNFVEEFLISEGYYDEFKNELELFKITQINNYLFTTRSNDYFKKAKDVFLNMVINDNNPLLSKSLIDNYYLISESDSLKEYVWKFYLKLSLELDNEITSIVDDSRLRDNLMLINNVYDKIDNLLSKNIIEIDKFILTNYIKSYKKLYYLLINTKSYKFSLSKLDSWTKILIDSNLPIHDKIDLLRFASFLFVKYYDEKLYKNQQSHVFSKCIKKRKYIEAIEQYEELYNDEVKIKPNHIYILFYGLEEEIGGVAKAVCDRANLLNNAGYQVTLLNNNPFKNSTFIIDNYHKLGYLSDSVEIINIYDYYSRKNTFNYEYEKIDLSKDGSDKNINKIHNDDDSIVLQYFNSKNKLVKEELYLSNYLSVEKNYDNGKLINEYYFTCDSFNYLYRDYKTGDFILFDRKCDCYISFNNLQEFEDYFVTELCLKSNEKPFLINDCSGQTPSIKKISSDVAYKVGVVHNNPYLKPYCFGSRMRKISSLSDYKHEDCVVLLTDSAKNDFSREFDYDSFVVIPNFITDENVEKSNKKFTKENNVISIFARISPEKNISDIIRAFGKVLKKHEDAILRIYGRALLPNEIKEKELLMNLAEKLGISNSVQFMGHVNNVFEEMGKSLATVLCSNIEGLPLVILESMINSTPVVSYDVNYGPRDTIINDLNGYVVTQYDINELSEAIIKILDDPENACKMGLLAKQHVLDNFTSSVVLEKWEKIFQDIKK